MTYPLNLQALPRTVISQFGSIDSFLNKLDKQNLFQAQGAVDLLAAAIQDQAWRSDNPVMARRILAVVIKIYEQEQDESPLIKQIDTLFRKTIQTLINSPEFTNDTETIVLENETITINKLIINRISIEKRTRPDLLAKLFKAMNDWNYDIIEKITYDELEYILHYVSELELKTATRFIETNLVNNINCENVQELYILASAHALHKLQREVKKFWFTNMNARKAVTFSKVVKEKIETENTENISMVNCKLLQLAIETVLTYLPYIDTKQNNNVDSFLEKYLPCIQRLDVGKLYVLSEEKISWILNRLPSQLEVLNLSGCKLKTIAEAATRFKQLTVLFVANCPELTSLDVIKELKGIGGLDLQGCVNLTNLAALNEMQFLISLNVKKCTALPNDAFTIVRGHRNFAKMNFLADTN